MKLTSEQLAKLTTFKQELTATMAEVDEITQGVRNILLDRMIKPKLQDASNVVGLGIIGFNNCVDWDGRGHPNNAISDLEDEYPILHELLCVVDVEGFERTWQGEVQPKKKEVSDG